MSDVHPRFKHQCFVSFNKFDHSINRVMDRTFAELKFDRTNSMTPTYIGIDVEYTDSRELRRAIRRFFERLRGVHQQHFVRFVTDTVWAMESGNGDIFYCHDECKDERVDVIWSVKALHPNQFEISVTSTPDTIRREILEALQYRLNNQFTVPEDEDINDCVLDIIKGFYTNTKNITSISRLIEDCHILLIPSYCGRLYSPVLLCGLSPSDAVRRWRGVKSQLEYQGYRHSNMFVHEIDVGDLLQIPMDLMKDYGKQNNNEFCPQNLYNAAELTFSILDGTSDFHRSPNDIILFQSIWEPNHNVTASRIALEYLTEVL